jgi:ABC-type antimicrobial peptide transport system permease subunit
VLLVVWQFAIFDAMLVVAVIVSLLGVFNTLAMPGITFSSPVATAVGVAISAIVLGALAAIQPARRAARINVVSAFNYE